MRLRALFPFLLAWVGAAAALSMVAILSTLDHSLGRGVTLDTLVRGDLHELLQLPVFWQQLWHGAVLPFLTPVHYVTQVCALRVALPIVAFAAALGVLWHRRGRTDFARAGLVCLGFAVVPWCVGRFLLTGIRAPEEAGQHLVLMVGGLFWCSVGSAVLCGLQLFARRAPGAMAGQAPVPDLLLARDGASPVPESANS